MRILVTGGAGYIGSHTIKTLLSEDHDITVLDWNPDGYSNLASLIPKDNYIFGDILEKKDLDLTFKAKAFDAVIHFAAFIDAGESVTNPAKYLLNNTAGTINLIESMVKHNVHRLIFSSSAAVYGEPESLPISELSIKDPTNPYGTSKLLAERAIKETVKYTPLKATILRYFNASGTDPDGQLGEKRTHESHLIPLVLQVAAGKRDSIKIYGTDYNTKDGTAVRDYIHVTDLAYAHSAALKQTEKLSIYNVGTGHGYSVKEVINMCRKVTNHPIPVKEVAKRTGDPQELVADATKIKQELGWSPKYSDLETIVSTAWKSLS